MTKQNEHLQSLAEKLNQLDLTSGEEQALRTLITGRGEEAEVGGFGVLDVPVIRAIEVHFTTQWSTSGDADDRPTEEVAFYYNKIVIE